MRWQCKECNGLLGNVIFTEKIEVLRFSYCPDCNKMTWQKTLPESANFSEDNNECGKKTTD